MYGFLLSFPGNQNQQSSLDGNASDNKVNSAALEETFQLRRIKGECPGFECFATEESGKQNDKVKPVIIVKFGFYLSIVGMIDVVK